MTPTPDDGSGETCLDAEGVVVKVISTPQQPEDTKEVPTARSASAVSLKSAVQKVVLGNRAAAKVPLDNKLGVSNLTGLDRELAIRLQEGIGREVKRLSGYPLEDPPEDAGSFEVAQPELFNQVRTASGMPLARYSAALTMQSKDREPNLRLISGSEGSGQSGAFFFLSSDQQVVVKSCTEGDYQALLRILPAYIEHLEEISKLFENWKPPKGPGPCLRGLRGSLLPRYLGLYKLKMPNADKVVRVVVMLNVLGAARVIHRRFDLKGSTRNRHANQKELAKTSPTLKDLDFRAKEKKLLIREPARTKLLEVIERDSKFLQRQNLIDYSLLVGIHDIEPGQPTPEPNMVVRVDDGSRLCYIGIIDVLTEYGVRKRMETLVTSTMCFGRDVSCQPPRSYAQRFCDFVETRVFGASE